MTNSSNISHSEHPDPAMLFDHVEGTLAPEQALAIEQHIARCQDCGLAVQAALRGKHAAQQIPVPAPATDAELAAMVAAALDARSRPATSTQESPIHAQRRSSWWRQARRQWALPALAAAGVLAIATVAIVDPAQEASTKNDSAVQAVDAESTQLQSADTGSQSQPKSTAADDAESLEPLAESTQGMASSSADSRKNEALESGAAGSASMPAAPPEAATPPETICSVRDANLPYEVQPGQPAGYASVPLAGLVIVCS